MQPCARAAALVVQLSLLFIVRSHGKRGSMITAQHLALTSLGRSNVQQSMTKRLLQVRSCICNASSQVQSCLMRRSNSVLDAYKHSTVGCLELDKGSALNDIGGLLVWEDLNLARLHLQSCCLTCTSQIDLCSFQLISLTPFCSQA